MHDTEEKGQRVRPRPLSHLFPHSLQQQRPHSLHPPQLQWAGGAAHPAGGGHVEVLRLRPAAGAQHDAQVGARLEHPQVQAAPAQAAPALRAHRCCPGTSSVVWVCGRVADLLVHISPHHLHANARRSRPPSPPPRGRSDGGSYRRPSSEFVARLRAAVHGQYPY